MSDLPDEAMNFLVEEVIRHAKDEFQQAIESKTPEENDLLKTALHDIQEIFRKRSLPAIDIAILLGTIAANVSYDVANETESGPVFKGALADLTISDTDRVRLHVLFCMGVVNHALRVTLDLMQSEQAPEGVAIH